MNARGTNAPAQLPATARGDHIYAIGDVHGRHDLLVDLLEMIADHARTYCPGADWQVIGLGDMVDRGPDSARVIELMRKLTRRGRGTVLMGNHEEAMLRTIDGEPGALRDWLRFGGDATLRSFGIEPPADDFDYPRVTQQMRAAIPESMVTWLRERPTSARSGDYMFCHAGIRPGVALDRQQRSDLLWIRDEFLTSDEAFGAVIVHGHSISPDVELRHNRIGLDTGAYRTNMLTAAYLAGRECHILSTGEPPQSGEPEQAAPDGIGTHAR